MSELPALAWIDNLSRKNEFRVLKNLDFPDPTGRNNSILMYLITSCETPISLNGQYSSTSFFNRFNNCRWKLKAFHTWINKKNLSSSVYIYLLLKNWNRPCRDRMVVGFITAYAIGCYHHWCCWFECHSGRGVQYYMIKFASDLRQVCSFLRLLRFSPPITLTATI